MADSTVSEGAAKLAALFAAPLSPASLAYALGISQQAVSNWTRGVNVPSTVHRIAIEKLTGIPADAWLTEEERKAIAACEERARGGA
jgi:transcriptional regulator with XRE-family HTH domain